MIKNSMKFIKKTICCAANIAYTCFALCAFAILIAFGFFCISYNVFGNDIDLAMKDTIMSIRILVGFILLTLPVALLAFIISLVEDSNDKDIKNKKDLKGDYNGK